MYKRQEVGVVLRKQVQHPAAQAPVPQAGHGAQVVQQGKGTARLQPNQGVGDQILPVVCLLYTSLVQMYGLKS